MTRSLFRNIPAVTRKNEPSRKPEFEDAMLEYVSFAVIDRATARLVDANLGAVAEKAVRDIEGVCERGDVLTA